MLIISDAAGHNRSVFLKPFVSQIFIALKPQILFYYIKCYITQFIQNMIIVNQEIAVHLKCIRNLTGYTSGRFAIRISVVQSCNSGMIESTPVNIIEKQQPKGENRSEFDQKYYTSRTFILKSGINVEINEVCVFKVTSRLFNKQEEQYSLIIICELLQVEANCLKVVDIYRGKLIGRSINEYLQMDYYQFAPIQILGSLHSCLYRFEFKGEDTTIDLKSYCDRYSQLESKEVLDYLQDQQIGSYKNITDNYNHITNKNMPVELVQSIKIEEGLKLCRSQKQVSLKELITQKNIETQQTEVDEQYPAQGKRKRRRIFGTVNEMNTSVSKYQTCEKILHEYSQKIYLLWRQIVSVLLTEKGNRFIAQMAQKYRVNLRERIGESITRFKGSWDVDIYCDQQKLRSQLANQLRNQDKQYFKDLKATGENIFPILNQTFFSSTRPIFFEEIAKKEEKLPQPLCEEILIIMVHGLGACRLDMEKIKVELRRYYDKKIKIYISTSNEGRTEGDIQNMGLRLATQLDYEFSKFDKMPKICMLGHSMGGVIIRTALPRLQKYKKHFHALITLSSPHLGYAYSNSKLVDAGLWIMNTMKKCQSILQLTMQDSEIIEETFLYKLSQKPGLQWFNKIVLLASNQDLYVPYYSARIQKHEQSTLDNRKQVKKGVVYCDMIDNLLSKFNGSIIRLNVNFCIPEQNIDNLIGRAAHISFITNVEMVRTLVLAGPHYFF